MTLTNSDATPDELFIKLVTDPSARRDPYPLYAALQTASPVLRSALGLTVLTGYSACQEVLRSPAVGIPQHDDPYPDPMQGASPLASEIAAGRAETMLGANPPTHTRLRRLVSRAFTPTRIARLEDDIRSLVRPLVETVRDRLSGGETVDLMDAIAGRLPIAVIGHLVGVPESDWERFRPLVWDIVDALDPFATDAVLQRSLDARDVLTEYMTDLIAQRRRQPQDDLTSAMLEANDDGEQLTEREIMLTAVLLFGAGFETTTNLLGNGLLALMRNPDAMRIVRAERSTIATAVDECLRYDSPVQLTARRVYEDVELGGAALSAGDVVMVLLGAANRDPGVFAEPDAFDVRRAGHAPLSFGWGIHHCLGAPLARLEAKVTFEELVDQVPAFELADDDPPRRDTLIVRGLMELPIVRG